MLKAIFAGTTATILGGLILLWSFGVGGPVQNIFNYNIFGSSEHYSDPISLVRLETRQQIYLLGDTANIDFVFKNNIDTQYNFKVLWRVNNSEFLGWSNTSTNFPNSNGSYYAHYPLTQRGDWTAIVQWNYIINNQSYSHNRKIDFTVT